jgi:predicted metal-dependent peptidase
MSSESKETLKSFLYDVQKKKDEKTKGIIKNQHRDRKNILNLKIVCIVDVSGSISSAQYREFMQHMDNIRGLSTMKVMECDTQVVAMYTYERGVYSKIFHLGGGGGTDLRPAYHKALEMNPDAIIIFSDGMDGANIKRSKIPSAMILSPGYENGCGYDWMVAIPMKRMEK